MKSINYPDYVTIPNNTEYEVSVDENRIFRGRTYNIDGSPAKVDLAEIVKYNFNTDSFVIPDINSSLVKIIPDLVKTATISTIDSEDFYSNDYAYDFNTRYESDINSFRQNNDLLTELLVVGQIALFSFYNPDAKGLLFYAPGSGSSTSSDKSVLFFSDTSNFSTGSRVSARYSYDSSSAKYQYFNTVDSCEYPFVIYYVNKYGAIDWLPCNGRVNEVENNTRTQIRTNYDRSDSRNFQDKIIQNTIKLRWELHINNIPAENQTRDKLENLYYTPKAWVHDLRSDLIYAANIVTNSFTVVNSRFGVRNNNNYQVTFEQSQDILRR